MDRVEIACGDRIVASHRRCYHKGCDVMDPYHYLPALLRKPRAFHQAKAVGSYPWPPTFRQALAFLEERLTAALLDRRTHRCHIIEFQGDSFRFKESLRRQRKATA